MNFKDYYVFTWTDKQLKKKYSKDILEKYYKILGYLYQNGFDLNCEENEIEEQLSFWDFFQNENDLEELRNISDFNSDCTVGKKIVIEELYDIIKNSTFSREVSDNPATIKSYATINWNKIVENVNRLENLFFSNDSEIVEILKKIPSVSSIQKKIEDIKSSIEREIKVLTWIRFSELINNSYSIYISEGKQKTDTHKLTIASNFNDELYGGIGGYNPNTGEIKCILGSAVSDVKLCYSSKTLTKVKTIANSIFKDNEKTEEDEEAIKYLERWLKGKETDDNYARQIVTNSCLHGVLTLLFLKYNVNFLEDKKNSDRVQNALSEFKAVLKYCGINKEYLL